MRAGRVGAFSRSLGTAAAALMFCGTLNGCLVAGYSAGEGWWVWPGSLVLTLILLLLFLLNRR